MTPDGVERFLRSTRGSKSLMRQKFGPNKDITEVLNEFGEEAMFDIAYFMMFDQNGNPPEGLTVTQFMHMTPNTNEATASVMAAIMSAVTQGKVEKKEIEPLMLAELDRATERETTRIMTSISGPSVSSDSD